MSQLLKGIDAPESITLEGTNASMFVPMYKALSTWGKAAEVDSTTVEGLIKAGIVPVWTDFLPLDHPDTTCPSAEHHQLQREGIAKGMGAGIYKMICMDAEARKSLPKAKRKGSTLQRRNFLNNKNARAADQAVGSVQSRLPSKIKYQVELVAYEMENLEIDKTLQPVYEKEWEAWDKRNGPEDEMPTEPVRPAKPVKVSTSTRPPKADNVKLVAWMKTGRKMVDRINDDDLDFCGLEPERCIQVAKYATLLSDAIDGLLPAGQADQSETK